MKYFNQSVPQNSYQTRQIVTRTSAQSYDNQTLRSYGPTTNGSSNTATVSLTGIVPSFSWSFNTKSLIVTDNSDLTLKYARWTVDIALGSSAAKNTVAFEPGARFTNAVGTIAFVRSHTINYYKNLNTQKFGTTGVLQRILPDL